MADSYNELMGIGSHSEDANLEGWWPLQDSSGTTVDDRSSNNYDGTLNGGDDISDLASTGPNSWLTQSLDLDGSADNISVSGAGLDISGDISILCFCRPDAVNDNRHILGAYNLSGGFQGYGVRHSNTSGRLEFWNGTSWAVSSDTLVAVTTWVAVGIVNDNSNTTFYKDGSAHGNPSHGNPSSWTGTKRIGSRSGGTDGFYNGRLGHIAIFSRALSSGENSQFANGPELNYSSGVSFADDGTYDVGTWALPAPFASGSNGTATYEVVAAKADGTSLDTATTATGTLDLSANAGNTCYLLVRTSNTGGYDIGDKATRTSSYGSSGDGYYEIASVVAAGGGGSVSPLAFHHLRNLHSA